MLADGSWNHGPHKFKLRDHGHHPPLRVMYSSQKNIWGLEDEHSQVMLIYAQQDLNFFLILIDVTEA